MAYLQKLIIFILFSSFLCSNIEFKNNPIKTGIKSNNINFKISIPSYQATSFNAHNIITIFEEKHSVKLKGKSYAYSPSLFVLIDESNNYFLFANNNYYSITAYSNEITSFTYLKSLPKNCTYFGYFCETKTNADSNENNIIIYGIKKSSIYFYDISDDKIFEINLDSNIENINCKFVKEKTYICAYNQNEKKYITIFSYQISNGNQKIFSKDYSREITEFSNFNNITLYDTSKKNNYIYKVLCALDTINDTVKCILIRLEKNLDQDIDINQIIDYRELDSYSIELLKNADNCYFTGFNSEYLLCCGEENGITCERRDINFNYINQFSIDLPGTIFNLTIKSDEDSAILYYMNNTGNELFLYQYFIYLPQCQDVSIIINHFDEFEINITEKMTNTNYYIKFENLPTNYGTSKINEEIINSDENIILLKNIINKYTFISTNYETTTKYDIFYNVSIEETYSKICNISLTIKACYHSCKKCEHSVESSNDDHHGCIICKEEEGYFPYRSSDSNIDPKSCFNENEVSLRSREWYFDKINKVFLDYNYYYDKVNDNIGNCHSNCHMCFGPKENNCLNCTNTNLFLYNNECVENCPENAFTINIQGQKICDFCYENCDTCQERGNFTDMKCDTCSEDKIKYKQNCFIVNDNNIKSFYNPENSSQITSCNELYGNYIIENTNECIDNIPNEGYFLSNEKTGLLSPCHYSCRTCSNNYTENNTNCIECNSGYYKMEDSETNCILQSLVPLNYYLNNTNNIYYKCYYACYNCTNGYDIILDNMNCISCIDNYYFIFGEQNNNCYNMTLIEKGYYFKNNMFYPCDENCLTCSDEKNNTSNNCLSCDNINKSLYLVENLNKCEYSYYSGYYLDNNSKLLKRCYYKCKTCKGPLINNTEINIENHNCIECEDSYYKLPNGLLPNNCYDNDSINLWKIGQDITSMVGIISTENIKIYLTILTSNYFESCPNNYEFNKEQNKCIIKYFDPTTSSSEFKNLILKNITSYANSNSSSVFNGSDFIGVILSSDNMDPKEQLKNGISAIDLGNCTQIIKNYYNISKEENLIILNIESKNNETQKSESNDNSFNIGKNTEIVIYDLSGRKLDISVCQENIKIMKYIKDLEEQLNIEKAMNLAEQGIDVFNASDDFFNDLCHQYDNIGGKDIIINDRRNEIYKNVTFCQIGCKYNGLDYELMIANCICDSKILKSTSDNKTNLVDKKSEEEKFNFKTLGKSIIANFLDFNLDVIYCSNLVFNIELLLKNIGFYTMSITFFFQIIFLIIYIVKKLKSLRYFMIIFNNNNTNYYPPLKTKKIKSIKINDESNSERNINNEKISQLINNGYNPENIFNINIKKIINKKLSLFPQSKNKKINSICNFQKDKKKIKCNTNSDSNNKIKTPIKNINKDKKLSKYKKGKIRQSKEILLKNNDKLYTIESNNTRLAQKNLNIKENILNKKDKNKIKKIGINNITTIGGKNNNDLKINKDIIKISSSDFDLQDIEYEQAILYDKRSFLKIYWAFLVDSQIILGTFCTENYLDLFVIKFSFLIFTFQISFFLNALFYTDEYISNAYHNDGILDFISGLPKSLYSFIATLVTTNLLKMLSNSKSELLKLIREKNKKDNYMRLINIKLRKLSIKLIIYFILVFLLGLLFLYYVSAFCSVYRYSQKYWFLGCLESFGIDSLVSVIICIKLWRENKYYNFIKIK